MFFKPDTLTLKPILIEKNGSLEQHSIVILDDKGSIPSDMTIYFDCFDEDKNFELYDIWVYRSSFDPTSEYKPCKNCDDVSLIEILKNQPYYAVQYFESNQQSSSLAVSNLIQFGQLEKSLINLPESYQYKQNQVRSINEAISENIFYRCELQGEDKFRNAISDIILIKDFLINEFPLESEPKSYLNVKVNNILADPLVLPQYREIAFRFANATTFDSSSFVFSFCCKNNDISQFQNIPVELYIRRIFGDPTNPFVSVETPFKLDYIDDIQILGSGWSKISRVCTSGFDIVGNMDTSFINEVYLSIRIPHDTIYSKYDISFTNFFVGFTENPAVVFPHNQTTIAIEEQWRFNDAVGKNAIYSPLGIVPEFPSTAGKIIDYLWVDKNPIGDKPTSIVADGRVLKVNDYHEYDNQKYINRIPYLYLFEAIGYSNGSGTNHFNAWSVYDMVDFPNGVSALSSIGSVLFHWNYQEFMPYFNQGNCQSEIDFRWISAGLNPYGVPVYNNQYPENLQNRTIFPITIEVSFCHQNSTHFSLSYLIDSNIINPADIGIYKEGFFPPIKYGTHLAGNYDINKTNTTTDSSIKKSLFSSNDFFYKSYGRVGGYSSALNSDVSSLPTTIRKTTEDIYNICFETTKDKTTHSLFSLSYYNYTFPTSSLGILNNTSTIGELPSWKLNIYKPNYASFNDNNPYVTAFITKYQMEMKCALMFHIKDATGSTFKTRFAGKYFIAYSRMDNGKNYCFWFKSPESPTQPINVVADIFIPINITTANEIISFSKAIEIAVNSYVFAIPNLQDAILYSVGNGHQTAQYGKEDVTNYAPQTNDRKALQGYQIPSSSNNFINRKSLFEAYAFQGFRGASTSTTNVDLYSSPYKNGFSFPRIPVIRHISLV